MKEQEPFEKLLKRYRGLLFSLCRHYSHRTLEVDDLLQEAAIALWRVRERLLPLPSVQQAALVWKVSRNAVIDCLRRTTETDQLPETYDTAYEEQTLFHELRERIALLDEPDRTIVRMQLDGYSYEEIAAATEMTEKNVSVRLVRVREKLRKEWNQTDR